MTKGTLKVTVVEAKSLRDLDFIGKSDPYIKLILGEKQSQSTTIKKGDLNPKYNEDLNFQVDGQTELKLEVWDSNTIGSDQLIGSSVVSLKEVYKTGYSKQDIIIKPKSGSVHLILEFA